MNYRHIYMCVIARAKSEEKQGIRRKGNGTYYESHHILPRSLFPLWAKRKSNFVLLTAREHFFCHQLLTKIFNSAEMDYALFRMCTRNTRFCEKLNVSSREYELAKRNMSQRRSEYMKSHPEYGKETQFKKGQTPHNKGVAWTSEQKEYISEKTKEAMKSIDMKQVMRNYKKSLSSEELSEFYKKRGNHRKLYGKENPMSKQENKDKVKKAREEASKNYKKYKLSGGTLSWNEWNKQQKS